MVTKLWHVSLMILGATVALWLSVRLLLEIWWVLLIIGGIVAVVVILSLVAVAQVVVPLSELSDRSITVSMTIMKGGPK